MSNKVTRIFRQIIIIICCLSIVLPSCNLDIPNNTKNNFNSKGIRNCYIKDQAVLIKGSYSVNRSWIGILPDVSFCGKTYTSSTSSSDVGVVNISQSKKSFHARAYEFEVLGNMSELSGSGSANGISVTIFGGAVKLSGSITRPYNNGSVCSGGTETITLEGTGTAGIKCDDTFLTGGNAVGPPPPPGASNCSPNKLFYKLNPAQEFVSPKDANGENDTMEFKVKAGCGGGTLEIQGLVSEDNSHDPIFPQEECSWQTGAGDVERIVSWDGKCNNGKYMANGPYDAKFTSSQDGSTSIVPVEVRNGGDKTNCPDEKFLTPRQISDGLHANSLSFLAPDNKTFSKLSFNEEFTHRSINELIDKQNEIKVLEGKISSLSARNLSTSSLLAQKAIVVSQRDALKQEIITGLESHKNKLRTSVNSLMNDPNYSVDSTDKPIDLEEYKVQIIGSDHVFNLFLENTTSYDLVRQLSTLADENLLLSQIINDYTNNTLNNIVLESSNTNELSDFGKLVKVEQVIKYLSEQISHHQDTFNVQYQKGVELETNLKTARRDFIDFLRPTEPIAKDFFNLVNTLENNSNNFSTQSFSTKSYEPTPEHLRYIEERQRRMKANYEYIKSVLNEYYIIYAVDYGSFFLPGFGEEKAFAKASKYVYDNKSFIRYASEVGFDKAKKEFDALYDNLANFAKALKDPSEIKKIKRARKEFDDYCDSDKCLDAIFKHKFNPVKGNKKEISKEIDRILKEIAGIKGGLSGLKGNGNIAFVKGNIDGIERNIYGIADKKTNLPGFANINYLKDTERILKSAIPSISSKSRQFDAEVKILESIAQTFKYNTNVAGEITLTTNLFLCPSCQKVYAEFMSKYPNIKVNIIYGVD